MTSKENFGEISSKDFQIGDIVEWRKWDSDSESFHSNYGILLELTNKVVSDRVVSIAKVLSIGEDKAEHEFFTLSLKLVSRNKPEVQNQ